MLLHITRPEPNDPSKAVEGEARLVGRGSVRAAGEHARDEARPPKSGRPSFTLALWWQRVATKQALRIRLLGFGCGCAALRPSVQILLRPSLSREIHVVRLEKFLNRC
jgi:hypothetical protein